MTNYFEPPKSSNPRPTVNREDYCKLIFSTISLYRAGEIGRQTCKSELCDLIRKYTDHRTWRFDGKKLTSTSVQRTTKFVVSWTTDAALIARSNNQPVEVDHAIPVEFIADDLMEIQTLIEMQIHLENHTHLVYVTAAEHAALPAELPKDYMKTYEEYQNPFMARYFIAKLPFMRNPDLEKVAN